MGVNLSLICYPSFATHVQENRNLAQKQSIYEELVISVCGSTVLMMYHFLL